LRNPDAVKYLLHDIIKVVLSYCANEKEFQNYLQSKGINVEYKHKRTTGEIEGISFNYDNVSFKGSQIDRKFSYGNLKKEFKKNLEKLKRQGQVDREKEKEQTEKRIMQDVKTQGIPSIGGVKLTEEQFQRLKDGSYIYLENMQKKDGSNLSAFVFLDDKMSKPFFTKQHPESFLKYGKYEMRLMDKMQIEAGFVTKAKVKWYGGGYAYPYLWKVNKSDTEYKESWGDPRITKTEKLGNRTETPKILKNSRGRKR
jgi:hypothetical protein